MMQYKVMIRTDGEPKATWHTFDGDDLGTALIRFLASERSDRRVALISVGEEFDEEQY